MSIRQKDVGDDDSALGELVDALSDVSETSPNAEANATTISDNNGGRIELDGEQEVKSVPSRHSALNQSETSRTIRIRLTKKPKIYRLKRSK